MNPARLCDYPEFTWKDYMTVTGTMQNVCDAVLFLPDWQESKGATEEHEKAELRGQKIFFSIKEIENDLRQDT